MNQVGVHVKHKSPRSGWPAQARELAETTDNMTKTKSATGAKCHIINNYRSVIPLRAMMNRNSQSTTCQNSCRTFWRCSVMVLVLEDDFEFILVTFH